MELHEFDIIERFFKKRIIKNPYVTLGIGDDAAIQKIPDDHEIVTSIDTLISGTHFPEQTAAADIGYKSLAVSISDIAAMGAQPISALLSITLPHADENWLAEFTNGFFEIANQYKIALIGGDTTRGPLSISTVVNGIIPTNQAIYRHQAQPGDLIYVSGNLGDAGLALDELETHVVTSPEILQRLNRPQPRVQLGLALRNIASAAIDISDGLVTDLKKIMMSSGVGAKIYLNEIPLSDTLRNSCPAEIAWQYACTAGDDYELCFTVPAVKQHLLQQKINQLGCSITKIGIILEDAKLAVLDNNGETVIFANEGYQHF